MFTKQQIEVASAKVKTGSDYPKLVYYGDNNHFVRIHHDLQAIKVTDTSSTDKLKHAHIIHQQGQTDYLTFCIQAGEAGVEKWISDLTKMTVTYLDKSERPLLVEPIPNI